MATKSKSKKDPNDVEDLNTLWVSIPTIRLELAKLVKEGYEQYPLGELLLLIRNTIRRNNGTES